ncbi:MAG TPA: aldose 1-epimerase [Steroidobacteraceae bacterium]|nr:aldose 1-epimerase [Steroidobacteraceae bacterium]
MFEGFDAPTRPVNLRRGDFVAEVWPEHGGAIASFRCGSRALLRPTDRRQRYLPTDLASFPLVPYSNRIANGRFQFAGRSCELPRNCIGFEHPLHGVGWIRSWAEQERQADRCVLRLEHGGDADWPWPFTATQDIALDESGLALRLMLINRSVEPMPFGIGQHPCICRPIGTRIVAPVTGVWLTDAEQLPTHRAALPREWNLPQGAVFDDCFVDHCFDGLDGAVRVVWPDGGELRMGASPLTPFLIVYSVPERSSICLEPVSQRPNAFNAPASGQSAAGTRVLRPGEFAVLVQRFDYLPPAPSIRSRGGGQRAFA